MGSGGVKPTLLTRPVGGGRGPAGRTCPEASMKNHHSSYKKLPRIISNIALLVDLCHNVGLKLGIQRMNSLVGKLRLCRLLSQIMQMVYNIWWTSWNGFFENLCAPLAWIRHTSKLQMHPRDANVCLTLRFSQLALPKRSHIIKYNNNQLKSQKTHTQKITSIKEPVKFRNETAGSCAIIDVGGWRQIKFDFWLEFSFAFLVDSYNGWHNPHPDVNIVLYSATQCSSFT